MKEGIDLIVFIISTLSWIFLNFCFGGRYVLKNILDSERIKSNVKIQCQSGEPNCTETNERYGHFLNFQVLHNKVLIEDSSLSTASLPQLTDRAACLPTLRLKVYAIKPNKVKASIYILHLLIYSFGGCVCVCACTPVYQDPGLEVRRQLAGIISFPSLNEGIELSGQTRRGGPLPSDLSQWPQVLPFRSRCTVPSPGLLCYCSAVHASPRCDLGHPH